MKRVLSADLLELRKSKLTYFIPGLAVLIGVLLPLMYYGLVLIVRYMLEMDFLQSQPDMAASLKTTADALTSKSVFLANLPLSQGFGVVMTAMIGFRAVRPFGTGIYRNKIIAGISRRDIFISQTVVCTLLSLISAVLFTLFNALTCYLTFGDIGLNGQEIKTVVILSVGIYLVYSVIPVYTAFLTRSVPLTLITSILLPILGNLVVSLFAMALSSAPDFVMNIFSVLPSTQCVLLAGASASDTVLVIAAVSDVIISAALIITGILRFKKVDIK